MLKSWENRREWLCQCSGLSLQHSRGWEEADFLRQGVNSEFVRIRIFSLGLAGASRDAAVPPRAEPIPNAPKMSLTRRRGHWIPLCFLLSGCGTLAPTASRCFPWLSPSPARVSPGSLCFGNALEPQTGPSAQPPQCRTGGNAHPTP